MDIARSASAVAIAALVAACSLAIGSAAYAATTVPSDVIVLPKPVSTLPTFSGIGLRPDRRLVSSVPGEVHTSEAVTVALTGDGTPASVVLDEHLRLSGTGNYLIYERGPAREARPLGDSIPPVLKLGTVIWQGFSPGSRDLAARLRLDPALEAERLPLRVTLSFLPKGGGSAHSLRPGGEALGPGTVTVRLENRTGQPQNLPSGVAESRDIARAMETMVIAARQAGTHPNRAVALPVAGRGLPERMAAVAVGRTAAFVVAPLRVVGTITAPGTTASLSGPATTLTAGGGRVNGVLSSSVEFRLDVPAASRVALDLSVTPTLDERTLRSPTGRTWAAWAQTRLSERARRDATMQLVIGAAAAARAASISPYVGADTPGPATTTFRYRIAETTDVAAAPRTLKPRPLALGLLGVAVLAVLTAAAALWRRL